ncbi:amidohydrolase family protein [Pseudactinotalea suaedae]|uniref:amidohydrolase family protein n=1 Tax=Pseudactinotalea suaedae TaxID=1524924 RepID=UPI001390BF63|nr:amidohydrolase family protein [Pseudactinotalea suaedae]
MRIDSHHHIWRHRDWPQTWIPAAHRPTLETDFWLDDWRAAATPHGVERAVLVQTVPDAAETPYLLAQAAASTVVAGVVGWLEPTLPPERQLSALLEMEGVPLVGIRLQAEYLTDLDWLASRPAGAAAQAAGRLGLTVDLLVHPGNLAAALQLCRRYPMTRFVVDHLGKPDLRRPLAAAVSWRDGVTALATAENVAVKVSGLRSSPGFDQHARDFVETVADLYGADRLMWGSDWPVSLIGGDYGEVVADVDEWIRSWSAAERSRMWSGSVLEWYGLDIHEGEL